MRESTVGNIGNFWLMTKFRFNTNFGPKKVDFFYFGAIFGEFSNFRKFYTSFWASKIVKNYFFAKTFYGFFMRQKEVTCVKSTYCLFSHFSANSFGTWNATKLDLAFAIFVSIVCQVTCHKSLFIIDDVEVYLKEH